jgi:Bacterial Ig-like domain/Bacterial Ig domain
MKTNLRYLHFLLFAVVVACNTAPSNPTPNPNTLTVTISSPTGTAYTNGSLNIQVVVSNGTPESVELLKGDEVLVSNLAAPYTYAWNTTSEAEGSYTLKARATQGSKTFESDKAVTVVVDRTAPTIAERTPAPGADKVLYSDPIGVKFSEALAATTVNSSNVLLEVADVAAGLTPTLSADGLSLRVQPTGSVASFPASAKFSLQGLTDRAGNSLSTTSWNWTLPDWLTFGDLNLNGETIADNASLVLDLQNRPILAYVDSRFSADAQLLVKHWDGNTWQEMGSGSLNHDPTATNTFPSVPSLVLDSSGNPVIAWTERDENSVFTIYVKHWNGSSWEAVGPGFNHTSSANGGAFNPSLGLDESGNPVVAWRELVADVGQIFVNRWNGSTWEAVGTTSLNIDTSKFADYPSLAVDPSGHPTVAWREGNGIINVSPPDLVYVKRWDGTAWQLLGGATPNSTVNANFETEGFAFSLDASGKPWVALSLVSSSATRFLTVVSLEGDSWVWLENDPRTSTANASFYPSLALDASGNPVISWAELGTTEDPRYVKRWNGSSWQQLGGSLGDTSTNYKSPLVLDSTGNPVVGFISYHDNTNDFVIVQANH